MAQPTAIDFRDPYAYAQFVVTAKTAAGDEFDATRLSRYRGADALLAITPGGLARPVADGPGATVMIEFGGQTIEIPTTVAAFGVARKADYLHDVIPVLSRIGCNSGDVPRLGSREKRLQDVVARL